jgi:hypothetical protein
LKVSLIDYYYCMYETLPAGNIVLSFASDIIVRDNHLYSNPSQSNVVARAGAFRCVLERNSFYSSFMNAVTYEPGGTPSSFTFSGNTFSADFHLLLSAFERRKFRSEVKRQGMRSKIVQNIQTFMTIASIVVAYVTIGHIIRGNR